MSRSSARAKAKRFGVTRIGTRTCSQLVLRDAQYLGAPGGVRGDQALLLQLAQGLPDRRAAGAELGRQVALDEPVTRLQPPAGDRLADDLHHELTARLLGNAR